VIRTCIVYCTGVGVWYVPVLCIVQVSVCDTYLYCVLYRCRCCTGVGVWYVPVLCIVQVSVCDTYLYCLLYRCRYVCRYVIHTCIVYCTGVGVWERWVEDDDGWWKQATWSSSAILPASTQDGAVPYCHSTSCSGQRHRRCLDALWPPHSDHPRWPVHLVLLHRGQSVETFKMWCFGIKIVLMLMLRTVFNNDAVILTELSPSSSENECRSV